MGVIHVQFEISVQVGAKFSAGGVGEQVAPPTPIAGSATDSQLMQKLSTDYL